MAKGPVFDTSVFSPHFSKIEKEISYSLLPTVVLYELVATSIDASTLTIYERWRTLLKRNDRLLSPFKSIRRRYLKKTAPVTKLRTLQNDALIARLAVKNDGFVVTADVDDFELISREMPRLLVVSAVNFFN